MMTGAWLSGELSGLRGLSGLSGVGDTSNLSGLSAAWPGLTHVVARHAAVAVFDSTLPLGRPFADYAARNTIPAFDIADDAGTFWHSTLRPRFAQTRRGEVASLIGLVRPSDYFVLTHLASRMGDVSGHRNERRAAHIAFAFTLTPHGIEAPR